MLQALCLLVQHVLFVLKVSCASYPRLEILQTKKNSCDISFLSAMLLLLRRKNVFLNMLLSLNVKNKVVIPSRRECNRHIFFLKESDKVRKVKS